MSNNDLPSWLNDPDDDNLPDWLDEDSPADPSAAGEAAFPPAAEDDAELPDWLNADVGDYQPAAGEPHPAAPASFDAPADSWGQSDEQLEGLTYAEWERLQEEREQEAARPKDDLPDIVPDWFNNLDAADSPGAGTGGLADSDYVPEWFMGVEELSEDEAPDWLKNAPPPPPAAPPPAGFGFEPPAADSSPELPDFDSILGGAAPAEGPTDEALPDFDLLAQPPGEEAPSPDDDFPDLDLILDDEEDEALLAALLEDEGAGFSVDDDMPDLDLLMDDTPAVPDNLERVLEEEGVIGLPPDDDFPDLDLVMDDEDDPAILAAIGFADDEQQRESGPLALSDSELSRVAEEYDLSGDTGEAEALDDLDFLQEEAPGGAITGEDFDWGAMDAALPAAADEAFGGESDDSPDWLSDYQDDAAPAPTAREDFDLPAEEASMDWLDNVDFTDTGVLGADEEDMPGLDEMLLGAADEDAEAPLSLDDVLGTDSLPPEATGGQDAFDLDSFLGEVNPFLPGTDVQREESTQIMVDSLDSLEGLGPDASFLDDLPALDLDDDLDAELPLPPLDAPAIGAEDAEALAASGDVPDWVKQLRTADENSVLLRIGGVETEVEQLPLTVLPPGLQALSEESRQYVQHRPEGKSAVQEGPLAGVEGALSLDASLSQPGELRSTQSIDLSTDQQEALHSLENVLRDVSADEAAGPTPALDPVPKLSPRSATARQPRRFKADRLLIVLLLLAAVLLPFLTDALHFADDEAAESLNADAAPIAALVDGLQRETATTEKPDVLVALEYSPGAALEMDPLVKALLRDIIAHGGRPVILSTNPLGVLHAETLIGDLQKEGLAPTLSPALPEDVAADTENAEGDEGDEDEEAPIAATTAPLSLESPADYLILPYLAGGAVGVRALVDSQPFTVFYYGQAGEDAEALGLADLGRLDAEDFAFLVVAGESLDDLRIWAEQLHEVALPKVALVSAATEPLLRPYLRAGSYDGMLSGLSGAQHYAALRDGVLPPTSAATERNLPEPWQAQHHSTTLGLLGASLFIALGLLINLIRGLGRRRAS